MRTSLAATLAVATISTATGCALTINATVNLGGTVNQITVPKSTRDGPMTSTTEASEANPAETRLEIPPFK